MAIHEETAADDTMDRRSVLGMLLSAGALAQSSASFAATDVAAPGALAPMPMAQPNQNPDAALLRRFMKLHGSVDDAFVPWYYTGRIYATQEATAPRHLFDFEGTEIYSIRRTADAAWTEGGSTLTFFRDRLSGAYLDFFDNPLTGRRTPVKPNKLGSGGKPSEISAKGVTSLGSETVPWNLNLNANGGVTWLTSSRFLIKAPQPWIEMQSMFAPTAQLEDPAVAAASSTFVSTYLAPWLGWMDMKGVPGNLVWHAAGRKMASLDELPADYRKRAYGFAPAHFNRL